MGGLSSVASGIEATAAVGASVRECRGACPAPRRKPARPAQFRPVSATTPPDPPEAPPLSREVPIDEGVPAVPTGGPVARACTRIANANWFQWAVVGAIIANALVLGLETYAGVDRRWGDLLSGIDRVFLVLFTIEIAIRVLAYGRRPWRFLTEPWNVFDVVVVGAGWIPGIGPGATALRLVRILRVVRILSVVPDLRVVVRGLARSIAPIGAVTLLALMLFYLYGMVGWLLFHEQNPAEWGDIGRSMLTLFEVLTLEDWVDVMDRGVAIHPWSWVFFLSFVLVAVFIVLNIVIAVVINSVETAREEVTHDVHLGRGVRTEVDEVDPVLAARIAAARAALDEVERAARELRPARTRSRRPPGGPQAP